jgi:hypothetical protein
MPRLQIGVYVLENVGSLELGVLLLGNRDE